MIDWISNWAGGIIIAVVIGTIIEMLLPEGNLKKYIKVVIGIYVLFTIVSPIITKFTGRKIEVSDVLDLSQYVKEAEDMTKVQNTMQSDNESNIKSIYLDGLKSDMKEKIKSKGYNVNSIDINISNDDNYKILGITLNVNKIEEEDADNVVENEVMQNEVEPIESINKIEIDVDGKEDSKNNDTKEENR